MNCPRCQRGLPADAAFCIYCAAQLRTASPASPQEPVTGATIRLDPGTTHVPARSPGPRSPRHRRHNQHGRPRKGCLGPVLLIGILFVLATRISWPGMLLLLGLLGFIRASVHGRPHRALRHLVFLGGMALLFWSGYSIWPGILLVMVLSHVLSRPHYGWRP